MESAILRKSKSTSVNTQLNLIKNSSRSETEAFLNNLIKEFHKLAAQVISLGGEIPKEAQELILELKNQEEINEELLANILKYHKEFSDLTSSQNKLYRKELLTN